MSTALDEAFEKIAGECAAKAGLVPCTIREYRDGLKQIIEHLAVCVNAAECDMKGDDSDG